MKPSALGRVKQRDVKNPEWRGPDGQGVSREAGIPLEWGEGKNVAWKTPIPGRGHSSPIDRVFLTTAIEGHATAAAATRRRHR